MKKFFLIGGGTGGHCIPMSVLYSEIIKKNKCYILTDKRGLKYFKDISPKKKILIKNLIDKQGKFFKLINILYIIIQSIPYYLKLRPDAVLGFGGLFTVPVIIAGWLLRYKIFLHEGNAIIGRANRFLLNFTRDLLTTFENTLIPGKKIEIINKMVGLPIRINNEDTELQNNPGTYFLICIIGGSQGAQNLSINIAESIKNVQANSKKKIKVYHQCRFEDLDKLQAYYETHNIKNDVRVFFEDMTQLLSKSNLVISRSGTSTVNEIIYYCLPSILIPYPYAIDNHQYYNAKNLDTSECTKIISDDSVSAENIYNSIIEIINDNQKVSIIKERLKVRRIDNPSKKIIDYLESYL